MTRLPLLLSACLVLAAPAAAQGTAPETVRAGYNLLHSGDELGALRHFNELLKTRPDDLQYRFGSLMARQRLIADDNSLIPAYEKDVDALIALADARYKRSERDADALRHLASGFMLRAEYRFEYDKGMWGAARDAAKAKGYSDAYVKQHPEHGDAYLVLGLYNYYVGIAPSILKVMRFLLFLPAGNRAEGLKQIERTAAMGDHVAPMAQDILIAIYSDYEGRPEDALRLADRLLQRFPDNDDFAMTAAGVYAGPALEDHGRAADVYASIVHRHQGDTTLHGSATRYRAQFALANQRVEQARLEEAIGLITPIVDASVTKPDWVAPLALLRRANYRALLNDAGAGDDTRRVQAEFKNTGWAKSAAGLQKWIEGGRASGEHAEYAALLPASRLAAERKWAEARKAYEAYLAKQPDSTWAQYRLAQAIFMSEPPEQTLPRFTALAANKRNPPAVRGFSLLHIARIHDLAGRRDEALKIYKQVADDYEDEEPGDRARIGLLTPYRKPAAAGGISGN